MYHWIISILRIFVCKYDGNVERRNDECVEVTKRGGTYPLKGRTRGEIKCKYISFDDMRQNPLEKNLEIELISPKGRVWVGMEDIRKAAKRHGTHLFIKLNFYWFF